MTGKTFLTSLFIVALAIPAANAQTLHLIIVPESSDRNIHDATKADAISISGLFQSNVSQNNIRTYDMDGQTVTAAAIQRQIQSVTANRQDTIVLYFSGHGAYNAQNGHYLQMANNQYMSRSQIATLIKSKGARLGVLLTESCFGFDPDGPSMSLPGMMENFRTSPLFAKLFFGFDGFVDINSCKEGQLAFTYPDTSKGSIFTDTFAKTLTQLRNRNDLGWDDVLSIVERQTSAQFKRLYPGGKMARTSRGRTQQRSQTPSFVTPLDVRSRRVAARPRSNPPGQAPRIYRPPPTINRRPSNNNQANNLRPPSSPQTNFQPQQNRLAYTVRLPLGITMGPCEDPGVHIKTVSPNSPATKCFAVANGAARTLSPNDHILAVNGVNVTTPQQVQQIVGNANELVMRIRLKATGGILDVRTSLTEQRTYNGPRQKGGQNNNQADNTNRGDRLGLVCRNCKDGVHIDRVIPGSPASRLQISPGFHVTTVANKPVNNVQEYLQALQAAPRNTWIHVNDTRGIGSPLTVTLAY